MDRRRGDLPHVGFASASEVVVLGGGLSGLSAIQALEAADFTGNIRLLERRSREDYRQDRTWCMWDVEAHPFRHLVSHQWTQWLVRDDRRTVESGSTATPYVQIRSDDLYRDAHAHFDGAPNVNAHFGRMVLRVHCWPRGGGATIETDDGSFWAPLVLDGRALEKHPHSPALLQSFVGWEITTAKSVFDPETVTLMDFRMRRRGRIEFFYILPFSPTRALVESTEFSPHPETAATHEARLRQYVSEVLGTSVREVHYREGGTIPMGFAHTTRPRQPHVYPIGLRGGLARPSTGYAFLRIQRDSERLAREIVRLGQPSSRRGSGTLTHLFDRIFLSFLARHPDEAPGIFLQLFDRVQTRHLVDFLSETGGPGAALAVASALPKLPFLREVASLLRGQDDGVLDVPPRAGTPPEVNAPA